MIYQTKDECSFIIRISFFGKYKAKKNVTRKFVLSPDRWLHIVFLRGARKWQKQRIRARVLTQRERKRRRKREREREQASFESLVSAQTYCLVNSFLHKGCIHSEPISSPRRAHIARKYKDRSQTMWARCQNTRTIRLICRISARPLIHTTLADRARCSRTLFLVVWGIVTDSSRTARQLATLWRLTLEWPQLRRKRVMFLHTSTFHRSLLRRNKFSQY